MKHFMTGPRSAVDSAGDSLCQRKKKWIPLGTHYAVVITPA